MKSSTKLSSSEITDRLKSLPSWRHENGAIVREYQTDGWPTTLMLVNAIGFFAEAADHHPAALWRPQAGKSALRGTTKKFVGS